MKKIITIFFIAIANIGFGQGYPIQQNIGSGSTLVRVPPDGGFQASLINRNFVDTTAANATNIKYYPGSQIFTTLDTSLWIRNTQTTRWLRLQTSGQIINGDTINYLVDVNRPPGQLNVYGKFFNGISAYSRLLYTDSIGSGGGSSYTFTAPLNESGGVVDLGGLSGFGTAGQTIRTTGSAFQYSDKLIITSGGNVHIKDTMKVNALSPLPIDESDFEIAVFPDLQNMIRFATAHSRTMFQWLKDSIASANVKAMLQVGDITDWNTQTEYDTLLAQLNLVTSTHPNFPYLFIPGNHDYAGGFSPSGRDSTNYNANLGIAHYSGKPFYGGHYGVSNENFFITFEAGSRKYLALGLEFFPRDVVVDWASNILDSVYAADPAREVMVVTHSYIDQRGERAVDSSTASTTVYGMTADNSGQELWDKLIRKKSNIRWVFSGHHIISGTKANRGLSKHIVSVGDNGNMVNQIFVNYQDDVNWGNGYFMRLQFKPSQNIVDVKYYSSLYDAYDTRPTSAQSFALENPNIDLLSSLAIKRDLSVGRDLRVTGKTKVENLLPMRFVFSDSDHVLRDTNMVMLDRTAGAGTVKIEGAINATKKVITDTSHLNYLRVMSRVNGLGKVYGNAPGLASLFVQDAFDSGTPSNYSGGIEVRQYADSAHKRRLGTIFRSYKNNFFAEQNAFTTYQPEASNGLYTRWYLKKGTYNITGVTDYHNANILSMYNHGAQEDSVTFNFGTTVLTGASNIFARQDFSPGSARYTITNGMLTNFTSFYKLTRAVNSETEWLNHFAAASPVATNYGQVVKTMVGLYIEPMTAPYTRRTWGVLQTGSTETHNALNNLIVGGDTTVANNLGAKLFVDGSVAIKDGTEGLGKVLTSDANGFATWETPSGGGGSSGITVGTTTITSGTNGRIGYNNSGVYGEKAVTGTGDVVLATSPTLVTPNIGVASGTSLTLSGLTTRRVLYNNDGLIKDTSAFTYSSSGELLVNTTTDLGNYKLQVGGNIAGEEFNLFTSAGSSIGRLTNNSGYMALVSSSLIGIYPSGALWLAGSYIQLGSKTYAGTPLGTSPTAWFHITAGSATANTAPLKFTSGTNLTTAEAGAMEYNGTNLFFSPSTTRYTVDLSLTGSATLDFGSTTPQTSTDLTITVTGAADGDVVTLGVPNGSTSANSCYTAWVSATNTVTVRFNNYDLVNTIDPASGTFKVRVIK